MNPNFEQAPFEKDLQVISKELREHQIKTKTEELKEGEVRDFLKARLGQPATSATPKAALPKKIVLEESATLPDYLLKEPDKVKSEVEGLVELAFKEGVEKASKTAAKSGPFILDAFHDALTAKLYEELKKRKLVK